ncbi:hypothetical protein ESCO_005073 [Escovopsis weberi]|uniref:Uncharacterized protein n=1 Tax=Escovopsis weberi TaxID=150374 RepID=A0A0M8N7A9_ESCWE|nr:hypothetical protein ESCO_005073 [Escovopsis weberi]
MQISLFLSAASVLLAPLALAAQVIDKGTGYGTYYYDIEDPKACYTDFRNINLGYVECSMSPLTLTNIHSNNLVAMDHWKLAANPALYCGKQVIVSVNGVPSPIPFFIGDGCERCGRGTPNQASWNSYGAPGLDFSYSQLAALNNNACGAGHIDISWEITNTTLFDFAKQSFVNPAPHTPSLPAVPTTIRTAIRAAIPTGLETAV